MNPTTLGSSLFFDPLAGQVSLGDIRQRIELKYAACLASGGTNGFPLHVNRIQNLKLRALAAAGMVLKRWNVKDLIECTDGLACAADAVLIATLEKPKWSNDDFVLMNAIEKLENLQSMALGGGRSL